VSLHALFPFVAGLLPTARRYDPGDGVVSKALLAGMAIMATSLVLFALNHG
jgi:hypothetical protein